MVTKIFLYYYECILNIFDVLFLVTSNCPIFSQWAALQFGPNPDLTYQPLITLLFLEWHAFRLGHSSKNPGTCWWGVRPLKPHSHSWLACLTWLTSCSISASSWIFHLLTSDCDSAQDSGVWSFLLAVTGWMASSSFIALSSHFTVPYSFPVQNLFQRVDSLHEVVNWSFSFSISPSSEYSGLISFRID